jgi:hypothetical protein
MAGRFEGNARTRLETHSLPEIVQRNDVSDQFGFAVISLVRGDERGVGGLQPDSMVQSVEEMVIEAQGKPARREIGVRCVRHLETRVARLTPSRRAIITG